MLNRLSFYSAFLRESLWFVPALMGATAIGLAVILLNYGSQILPDGTGSWVLYDGDGDTTRGLISTLLSGMITMFSLVLSITMVVLTLAAGQIGPRLIRAFMADRQTQTVLGFFLSDILYLLVIFRSLDSEKIETIPHLAVTFGTIATAACLFVLLFYVHKLARSIVYDNVVRGIALELRHSALKLLPQDDPLPAPKLGDDYAWLPLGSDGYVQSIDFDALIEATKNADAILRLDVRPGHFVLGRGWHVAVHPKAAVSEALTTAVRNAFTLGAERTQHQDIEYGLRQLVEIAVRALSPGINDVYTALAVVDNMASALAFMLERGLEPRTITDGNGTVRIVRDVADHESMVEVAFNQLRQAGARIPAILIRLTKTIHELAPCVRTPGQRKALSSQLDNILETAEKSELVSADLHAIRQRHAEAIKALAH